MRQPIPACRNDYDFIAQKQLLYTYRALCYAREAVGDGSTESAILRLTSRERVRIIRGVARTAERRGLDARKLFMDDWKAGSETDSETLFEMHRNVRLRPTVFKNVLSSLSVMAQSCEKRPSFNPLQRRVDEVASLFGLNGTEKEMLLCMFLIHTDAATDVIFVELSKFLGIKKWDYDSPALSPRAISIMTGEPRVAVERALRKSSSFIRSGILGDDRELASEVVEFLQGYSDTPIRSRYFREFKGEAVPLEYHVVEDRHIRTIEALKMHRSTQQPVNILLYGVPGTGKTEFARSLGRHLGLRVYEIRTILGEEDAAKENNSFRYRALTACQRMVDIDSSMVIIDEADTMLNSRPAFAFSEFISEKGQINHVLDEVKGLFVWIVNRHDGIDESTRRRFDYSVGFDRFTFVQRRTVWRRGVRKHGLSRCFSAAQLDHLASTYEINAGGIDIALRNAAKVSKGGKKPKDIMPIVDSILNAHLKFLDQSGKSTRELTQPAAPEYGLEGLNVHGNLGHTMTLVNRFSEYWASSFDTMAVRNMNLLLYGPPGSGKTEFAKYVARTTKRRLIVKKASDLLSCWLGDSEKNIRSTFEEAERDRAILFLDEADSLFWNREGATRSWEVTQVNELLTSMETFKGMLICSTNFKRVVDSAAIRRFNIKLEFDYLKPEGNVVFYRRFMARLVKTPLDANEEAELRAMTYLTPGDFKVVYQKYGFFAPADLSHRMLLDALREEVMSKNENIGKKMGFGKSE